MKRTIPALAALAVSSALAAPTISGCPVLPADNYWNTPVDNLPVHPSSAAWVAAIGNSAHLHADWGNVLADNYGIPFATVGAGQPKVPIVFPPEGYGDESDPGPYPIASDAPIEGGSASGGDRHVIVVDTGSCILYELYYAFPLSGGSSWSAYSAAKYDLASNALRPAGWTSADAAGLPIFPGLVRWDEVAAGEIAHAIRFTAQQIWGADAMTGDQKYLWPGRHASGSNTTPTRPPMGARFRLKGSFDVSPYSPETQVILRAFKKYGLVLADGGSSWYFQGVSDTRWPDAVFSEIAGIAGSDFEAVETSALQVAPDSGQALQGEAATPARLANISTRGEVGTGAGVMIGGFAVSGGMPKRVVIRALGPSLAGYVTNPLANPTLQLVRMSDGATIATNDDWGSAPDAAEISANGFAPSDPAESAILATLDPGLYTAILAGAGGATGVGLVEVYELDHPQVPLINISTRGEAAGGVMIGGFVIQGSASRTVVVRAIGPSLAGFVSNPLANPTLQLVRMSDNATIATNDDWASAANAADISASGFAPSDALESAILVTLPPGAYTAIVSGAGGTSGVGSVEVYQR